MYRPAWLRAFVTLWAIWLQAALLDPGSFDRCPEHARYATAGQPVAHAGHAAHASHEHGAPTEHHGQHACTCLGACCCAAPVALPATNVESPVITTVDHAPIRVADVAVVPAIRPHSLPFANGPPNLPASAA